MDQEAGRPVWVLPRFERCLLEVQRGRPVSLSLATLAASLLVGGWQSDQCMALAVPLFGPNLDFATSERGDVEQVPGASSST